MPCPAALQTLVREGSWVLTAGALLAVGTLAACERAPSGPACLRGSARDDERLVRLQQRLGDDPDARSLIIATQGRYVVCFGDAVEPGVDPQHRLLLDADQDDARAAAKLGHLLMHVSRGLPFDDDGRGPCAERLARARELEQDAHALESRLLQRSGLPGLEASTLERVMAGYRQRCDDQDAGASSK